MKIGNVFLSVILLGSLSSPSFAASSLFGNASCDQIRAAIADAERQLKEWEEYKARGGPGSGTMDLGDLRSKIRAGKSEYSSQCPQEGRRTPFSAGPSSPPEGGEPKVGEPAPNAGLWGKDGDSNQAAAEDPWAAGGPGTKGPDENPWAGSGGGNQDRSGPSASSGGGVSSGSPDGGGGAPAAQAKDPSVNWDGKSCMFFTKPPTDTHLNAYADEAQVCHGEFAYECVNRHWVYKGKCSAWRFRQAAEIEN